MRATTLEKISNAERTAALQAAYTGYFVPLHFSEEATENYVRVHDVVLAASPVWMHEGRPAGVAALGVRGARGWVGAFGISPPLRGRGLAQAMFGEVIRLAKVHGCKTVGLEVLDRNLRAQVIYERAGFKIERRLYTLDSPLCAADAQPSAREVAPEDISALISQAVPGAPPPCWQREVQTLQHRANEIAGVRTTEEFALYRTDGHTASLSKTSLDKDVDAIFAGIVHASGVQQLAAGNEPEDSPLFRQLMSRGWTATAILSELRLTV
ncbi:MAG: hypothetical protein NVS9B12_08210 [Vulcanimicrobiaceae bacterium]